MPRLHTSIYIQRHYQLKTVWDFDQRPFAFLSPSDQLALHKYFQFASDKTDTKLIEHRRNVHALDPSLPHRAGRAYTKLLRGDRAPVPYSEMPDGRRIAVRMVMRPEPDLRMLAKIFIRMATEDLERDDRDETAA